MTGGGYECVGGPWDGRMVPMHEGDRLRIPLYGPPQGIAGLTDEELAQPVEMRTGLYQLYRPTLHPDEKHLTYLKWIGEE